MKRTLPLLAAQTFFLWMFFSTAAFERDAIDPDVHRFAARWRHGMTGRWLLHVPGFLASAVAVWVWGLGRTTRDLVRGSSAIIAMSTALALPLAPVGSELVARDYVRERGPVSHTWSRISSGKAVLLGVYTLFTWTAVVLSLQAALVRWSWWPLLIPVVLDAVLIVVRPFTFGDLVGFWAERTQAGDPIAVLSLGVSVAAGITLWQLARPARGSRRVDSRAGRG
jgi:hypothetical protein